MIRLIEIRNYRSLLYISQQLDRFHVLVGANASGKTTFLDAISFAADIVVQGIDYAIQQRSRNYADLTFAGQGGDIELALELEIPPPLRARLPREDFDRVRYEVRIGLAADTQEHAIKEERVLLARSLAPASPEQRSVFPDSPEGPRGLPAVPRAASQYRLAVEKAGLHDRFTPETSAVSADSWLSPLKLGIKKSALGSLPADETLFPVSSWLKEFLSTGIQLFVLDSLAIRRASPPGQTRKFKPDGSNLPWVIEEVRHRDPRAFRNWLSHLQTALPDVADILTVERQDDRHRYLKLRYQGGIEVPSWLVSDGTLRMLALTLPAYLPEFEGVYLIEEPENGIHPRAVETVYQSLSSVYHAQMLLASHSLVILSMVSLQEVLCFAKTGEGITDIVRGAEHPKLRNWKGETNLSLLFAGGVLS